MSNKSFLHTIVAPNLTDSNFGQSIKTQFDNINTNFQRLVSAAYLSGQDGNDVVVKDVPIYTENITVLDRTTNEIKVYDTIDVINEFLNVDDVSYEFVIANDADDKYAFLYNILQQAVFTDFGLQLVETIFDEHPFTLEHHTLSYDVNGIETVASDLGYVLINEDLEYMFPSYSDTNRYPVWLAFAYSPVVRMFAIHDIDTDTITNICATQLYYFYDARIGSIQLLDDKYSANDFTDYTSFITISSNKNADDEYEINGTYTMSKSQDLPTLYYDNDAQEFCWKMNGIETNITAQGVKGDKGEPAGCWFCRGVGNTIVQNGEKLITVGLNTYYTYDDETGTIILRSVNDENCEIKNGDFVCVDVYNSDATNNTTYFDTIFGNVDVRPRIVGDPTSLVYTVTRPYYTSVMSMIDNSPTLFYEQLKRISGNGLNDALHGLFVPSYSSPSVFVHMINGTVDDGNETLTIHPVSQENANGILDDTIVPTMSNLPRKPNIVFEGYASVKMKSSDLDVDGNVNVAENIKCTVNGVNDVYVGTPIGTVVDYYGETVPEGWVRIGGSTFDSMDIRVAYGTSSVYYDESSIDVIIAPPSNDPNLTMYLTFNDKRMINIFILLSSYGTSQYLKAPNGQYMKQLLSEFDEENPPLTDALIKEYTGWPFSVRKQYDGNCHFYFGTFEIDNNLIYQGSGFGPSSSTQPDQPGNELS